MNIGVIGVGIITTNVIEGFLAHGESSHFFNLSPRNNERSAMLERKYPKNVKVAASNQEVLDNSEYVFLGLLPENTEQILSSLKFKREHKVIGLIPIIGLPKIKEIIGETKILVDVVPIPFISKRMGPIVVYPPIKEIIELLEPMGKIVSVETEKEISILRTSTGLISSYYELINSIVSWCVESGLKEPDAKAFITSFFEGLSKMAAETPEGGLKELAEEMTPGGLNYQAVCYLQEKGSFEHWKEALTPVLDRVRENTKDVVAL